ncbi:PQQ-binding-like beta-propeller repeat protein [Bradymonas sediminis]|uniref:Pyrrolo-quinoline quinone repeat domain-containing protein n=1 Tax=Bradymonas sediminis TaxID=1548548 RepID=A0A2Z4FKA0_9DELT|nr:PQQ-binding-like beta-propeller repeat protein [Bradymonas sediminis]AWV89373.1 hypothetical protein DN745_08500 [Bradymonas sediminis]TDP73553.1 Beta-barrel assembly machine subunit BamB [Bradymonas sediminis]
MPNKLRVLLSQARRHNLRALSLAAVILAGVAMTGCASNQASQPLGSASGVEPFAVQPHFSVKWRRGIDAPPHWSVKPREFSTPLYRSETDEVYVGSDAGSLFKMRGGNGEVLWTASLDGAVHGSVVYGGGRVYVGTLGGKFYALNEATGEVEWELELDGSIESTAVYAEERVFFTTSKDILTAADAATGKQLWTYGRSTPEYFTIKGSGDPVVEDGVVYCGFGDGVLAALQLDSGDMIWESDLSGGKTEFVDVDGHVTVSGSRVYAASYDGGVYAIDKSDGTHIWKRPMSGVADLVYGERTLYVATASGRVTALEAEDGSPAWSYKFEDEAPVAITATQLYLFISTAQGPLYTLDRLTGFPFMTWNPSNGFNTPMVLSKNGGFAYSNRGFLYHLDIAF